MYLHITVGKVEPKKLRYDPAKIPALEKAVTGYIAKIEKEKKRIDACNKALEDGGKVLEQIQKDKKALDKVKKGLQTLLPLLDVALSFVDLDLSKAGDVASALTPPIAGIIADKALEKLLG